MKVLFLDIDGVLNNASSIERFGTNLRPDPGNVEQVNRITALSGARIVVISNWREGKPLWYVQQIMGGHLGLKGDVIGMTPDLKALEGLVETPYRPLKDMPLLVRGQEISRWLASNPYVTRYAIIDDHPIPNQHWVWRTDSDVGLTHEIADTVIKHLNA